MNDYVAEALMNIGKNLPVQLRQNRLDKQNEEDRKRQMMSDDVALELSKMNLQSAKDKTAEDQAAKTAVEDATRGIQRQKQFEDLNALEEMYGMPKGDYNIMSNRDVAINSNVPSFSGNDRAKEFMSTFVEKPEDNALKEKTADKKTTGGGPNVWSQKNFKYKTIPEALPRLRSNLDEALSLGIIDEYTHKNLYGLTDTDPATAELRLANYIDKPAIGAKTIEASTDPKVKQTAQIEGVKGNIEALTPSFKSARKKEWDSFLAKYNEAYQQFALGKNAPDNNTGDVALINSLEKLRELNSAVMYGDYEKWVVPAQNMLQGLQDSGMFETIMAKGENRLPADVRKGMQDLIKTMWDNRKSILVQEQQSAHQYAKDNYGWDDKTASSTYRMPKLGYEQGDTDEGKKPIVTKPTTQPKPAEATNNPEPVKKPKFKIVGVK